MPSTRDPSTSVQPTQGTSSGGSGLPVGTAGGDLSGQYPNPTVAASEGLKSATTVVVTSAANAPTSGQVLTATGGSAAVWASLGAGLGLYGSTPPAVDAGTAAVGSSGSAAPGDHKHTVSTASAVALAVGGTSSAGSATTLAKSDHTHALPAFGTTTGTIAQGDDARFTNSRAPNGAAGGDLSGTYPSPTVSQAAGLKMSGGAVVNVSGQAAPTGANQVLTSTSTSAAGWSSLPTSLPPSGTAGGDLSGTFPSPSVTRAAGLKMSNGTVVVSDQLAPTASGQILTASGTTGATWTALQFVQVKTALATADSTLSLNGQRLISVGTPRIARNVATKHYHDMASMAVAMANPRTVSFGTGATWYAAAADGVSGNVYFAGVPGTQSGATGIMRVAYDGSTNIVVSGTSTTNVAVAATNVTVSSGGANTIYTCCASDGAGTIVFAGIRYIRKLYTPGARDSVDSVLDGGASGTPIFRSIAYNGGAGMCGIAKSGSTTRAYFSLDSGNQWSSGWSFVEPALLTSSDTVIAGGNNFFVTNTGAYSSNNGGTWARPAVTFPSGTSISSVAYQPGHGWVAIGMDSTLTRVAYYSVDPTVSGGWILVRRDTRVPSADPGALLVCEVGWLGVSAGFDSDIGNAPSWVGYEGTSDVADDVFMSDYNRWLAPSALDPYPYMGAQLVRPLSSVRSCYVVCKANAASTVLWSRPINCS